MVETKRIKIADLVPYANNPRMVKKAVEAVKNSLMKFGYLNPIIVNEDNVILAGHTRLMALEDIGTDEVDCVVVRGLSEAKQKAFRIADNRTAEFAEWDHDKLKEEMKAAGQIDWSLFGFKKKEIDQLKPPDVCECPKCGKRFYRT